jgi:hypothetical protein
MGTCTYNGTTNTITITGYLLGVVTPWGLEAVYDADKAGIIYLDTRTGISAVDGASDPLTSTLRPADYRLLGGNRYDLGIATSSFNFTTTQSLTAYSRWLSAGTETSGTYADTATDNGTEYVLSEEVADPCLFMSLLYLDAVRDSTSISVHIHGYYIGGVGHTVDVSLWNNTTSELDFIGTMPNEASEQIYTFNASGTISDYVNGSDPTGAVEVFFNHVPTDSATPAHELHLDQVIIDTVCAASATVTLIGTDAIGNAQTEDIIVTGNLSYDAKKYFRTLTASQVTAFTGVGSFDYNVHQHQWGVVWKQGNQYLFDCKLIVGDGSTETYWFDHSKQICFNGNVVTGNDEDLIYIRTGATFNAGSVLDAPTKTSYRGINFTSLEDTYTNTRLIYADADAVVNLYSSTFFAAYAGMTGDLSHSLYNLGASCRVWNCNFPKGVYLKEPNCDVSNNYICQAYYFITNPGASAVFSRTICSYASYGLHLNAERTITDFYSRGATHLVQIDAAFPNNGVASLVDADVDAWTFEWHATPTGESVNRKCTFNLTVLTSSGAAVGTANCSLKDNTATEVFNVDTNASGVIATQTVTRGFFNQPNGDTLQDKSPHTLTISKAGYETFTQTFTLTEETSWVITLFTTAEDALTPALSGDAAPTDVADGRTFYNTDATTKLTGSMLLPLPTKTRTIIKRVENPADEALLMATGVLLVRNRQLKRKLKEYKK